MTEAMTRGVPLSSTAKLRKFGNIMKQQSKEFFKQLTATICTLMIAFLMTGAVLICVLLGGCTRKVYVPVENTTVRTDTVTHYINGTDSVTVIERVYESDTRYDSIAPIVDSLGRVLGYERWHFRERTQKDSREIERLKSLVDSLKAMKRDSVDRPVPYPVERPLTKWEQTKMDFGGMFLGGLIAVVVSAVIVWIVKRKRRK